MKESIAQNEIEFLLFTLASEESILVELHWEFEKWVCEKTDIISSLSKNIETGSLLISKRTVESFSDLSIELSLEFASSWEKLNTKEYILFLTESGEKQWEEGNFGITRKRAKHLVFSNQDIITRVQ